MLRNVSLENYIFRCASISSIQMLRSTRCASFRLASLLNHKTLNRNIRLHDFHDLCTCKCEEPRGTWMWRPSCRRDGSIWISVDTTPSDDDDDEDDDNDYNKIMMKIVFTKSWLSAALAPAMTQSWAQTRAISMFIWITWVRSWWS